MFGRITILIALIGFTLAACEKNGGRPAPNSVPVQPPPPAQAPQATQQPGTPDSAKQQQPENPDQPEHISEPATQVKNTKIGNFNNGGQAEDVVIKSKSFFVSNWDPKGMPEERREFQVQQNGKSLYVSGKDITHLSDEGYIACSDPRCINRIADESEYAKHARNCWFPSIAPNVVARLEFSFNKDGKLRFLATIDRDNQGQVRFGARNIAYRYDGNRHLSISPFVASAEVDGEQRAIYVSGYTVDTGETEENGAIHLTAGQVYSRPGFNLKVTLMIDEGTPKNGQFVSGNSGRYYVGGTIAALSSTTAVNFKTFTD